MTKTTMWQVLKDILEGKQSYPYSVELDKKSRGLIGLRQQFENLIAEHPEDADALEQIYESERRKIIEREPSEELQKKRPGV